MTRVIAGLVLGAFVAAVLYLGTVRPERNPLLIDAAARTHAAPNMLFAPCPMAPQNIPPRPSKETAA